MFAVSNSAAGPAGAFALTSGVVSAVGRTSAAGTVQFDGTDKAPTLFAPPKVADIAGAGSPPGGKFQSRQKRLHGAGPVPGQGLYPVPAAESLIALRPEKVVNKAMGKSADPGSTSTGMTPKTVIRSVGPMKKTAVRLDSSAELLGLGRYRRRGQRLRHN